MENAFISKMLTDFADIKTVAENKNEMDLQFLINKMKSYSKTDLCFLKDCIDFMILYVDYK